MGWAEGDLRIFAAGLAIGGGWNMVGEYLPPPTTTVPPGTYYGQTLEIKLSAAEGIIRYTTDGTVPDADGNKYEKSLLVERNQTICAYAQKENRTSRISSFRYLVENPFIVSETIDPDVLQVSGEHHELVLGGVAVELCDSMTLDGLTIDDNLEL